MRILPVIDLMRGLVVRGVGGRRREYTPIRSRLTDSTKPVDVALAFRDHFGLMELYLADLDALSGSGPAFDQIELLRSKDFLLSVDAGVRSVEDGLRLANAGANQIIAALETLPSFDCLSQLIRALGSQRVIFSLDLRGGQSMGMLGTGREPLALADEAIMAGVTSILVLDVSRVGKSQGTATAELCQQLNSRHPTLHIAAGGGVRDADDLAAMKKVGVQTLLIASALHDGILTAENLRPFLDA